MCLSLCTCAPVKYNQYVKDGKLQKRDGYWKEPSSSEAGEFITKGKYKYGEKIRVWKTTLNGKPYQKEVYHGNLIKTKFYHPNGKVKQQGNSKMEITDNLRHWFYEGEWRYFNEKGKLIYIKNYHQGQKADSINVSK